jgi:hypothetical protein
MGVFIIKNNPINMKKQLLIETIYFTPTSKNSIYESTKSDRGNLLVQGVLATAELKNGNGRYYSKELWEREMDLYLQKVNKRCALGELDHPESQIINLKNVSHNITKFWWVGDNLHGEIEILPTPSGNILRALLENRITVGVSSRGMGSLVEVGGILEVQNDFELLCWDFVSDPSNSNSTYHIDNSSEGSLNESIKSEPSKYSNFNNIVRELICLHGTCPL